MNPADKAIADSIVLLRDIFNRLDFNADEKLFVNQSARRIVECACDLFEDFQPKHSYNLRPVVIAVAIGSIVGLCSDELGFDVLAERWRKSVE